MISSTCNLFSQFICFYCKLKLVHWAISIQHSLCYIQNTTAIFLEYLNIKSHNQFTINATPHRPILMNIGRFLFYPPIGHPCATNLQVHRCVNHQQTKSCFSNQQSHPCSTHIKDNPCATHPHDHLCVTHHNHTLVLPSHKYILVLTINRINQSLFFSAIQYIHLCATHLQTNSSATQPQE